MSENNLGLPNVLQDVLEDDGKVVTQLKSAFHRLYQAGKLEQLGQTSGDGIAPPDLKIVPSEELHSAKSAYSPETNSLYLAQDYLAELFEQFNKPSKVAKAIAREFGNAIAQTPTDPSAAAEKAVSSPNSLLNGDNSTTLDRSEVSVRSSDGHESLPTQSDPVAGDRINLGTTLIDDPTSQTSKLDLNTLTEGIDYAAGEVIVKFKSGIDLKSAEFSTQISALQQEMGAYVLESTQKLGIQLLKLNGMRAADAIAKFSDNPLIEYIEPNYTLYADALPNDPSFNQLWGLHNTGQAGGTPDADIDAPEAWDIAQGNGVVVGVIDTGVDYTHPDLANNMWVNPGETAGDGIDNDGNGYVDDIYGYDFANNDSNPFDDNSHGTHVAGTIAARGNNNVGVIGVAPEAKIMALKFLGASGSGSLFNAIQAIEYATMMGADLTNNSWGGGGFSQAMKDAIAAGPLFVAAAGNSGLNTDLTPSYPASYDLDNIISVAATDRNDQIAGFSNYGATSVDLGAPGVSIYSTIPGGGYASYSGTSMASPHVAGVAALILSQHPDWTPEQVKEQILNAVDPIAALDGITVSGGRLNAYNALSGPSALNLSFETGDFTDWDTIGDATIQTATFGSNPTDGTYQALIATSDDSARDSQVETFLGLSAGTLDAMGNGDAKEGSALKLVPIAVNAGDVLTFDWNFLTKEDTPSPDYNDFGFVSISSDPLSELADTNSTFIPSTTLFSQETGYGQFSYVFETAGTYTIGLGVMDAGDTSVKSAMLVDNFAIAPLNLSFETGDFTHWDTIGNTSIQTSSFGSNPTDGDYQALISNGTGSVSDAALETELGLSAGTLDGLGNGNATQGSAIQLMPLNVKAGDVLTFDWNFLTNEGTPSFFNDFGFISILSGGAFELADTNSAFVLSPTSFNEETGYGTFSYLFTEDATIEVGLGVVDAIDSSVDSALLVDNFQVTQLNGSFETGDFTHWDTIGNTSIQTSSFGSNPTDGDYQALISNGTGSVSDAALETELGLSAGTLDGLGNGNATQGSAIQLMPLNVKAGDVLTFDWNFLTNEGTPSFFNDFGFVSIASGDTTELADTNGSFVLSPTSFNEETGYGTFSYEFTDAGTYTISLGVMDAIDTIGDSALLVDNFSIVSGSSMSSALDFTDNSVMTI